MPRTQPKPRRRRQPVKPGLKGFANARKSPNALLREIQTHVVAQEAKHGNEHREDHKIHVSELTKDSCPRMLYYKVSHAEPTDTAPGAWHQLVSIWSAGTAEHEKWQRWLREMGELWGTWTCLQCDHTWEDLSPPCCEKCAGDLLRYDEVNLEDTLYPLVGHADGAVPRLNSLIEIKSFSAGSVRVENARLVAEHTHKVDGRSIIDHDGLWKAVKRPLRSHLYQGLLYLWMCKRSGLPYDNIIFIYENKTTQATKSFEIKYSDRHIKQFLDLLDEIETFRAEGIPPARPELFAKDANPCKACIFRTKCWETDDTGEESPAVQAGGPSARSEAPDGGAAVHAAAEAEASSPFGPRRHRRSRGRRTDVDDDRDDSVGRAPRRATRDGGGGRAVGERGDGEGEGPRFARRHREGRDPAEG